MSFDAMTAALLRPGLTPTDKMVLTTLAMFADTDEHKSWPKQQLIANITGFTRRTINKSLRTLEDAGLVASEQQYRSDGFDSYKYYWLTFEIPRAADSLKALHAGVNEVPTQGVNEVHSQGVNEVHSVNKSLISSASKRQEYRSSRIANTRARAREDDEDDGSFDDVFELFPDTPRRSAKKDLLDELLELYNAERTSPKGSLTKATKRSKARDAAARGFLRDMKRNDDDPREVLRVVTRYAAQDDYYLGLKGDPRRGIETVMRNWLRLYESAQGAAQLEPEPAVELASVSPGQVVTWSRGSSKAYYYVHEVSGERVRVQGMSGNAERRTVYEDAYGSWRSVEGMMLAGALPFELEVLNLAEEQAERQRRLEAHERRYNSPPQIPPARPTRGLHAPTD